MHKRCLFAANYGFGARLPTRKCVLGWGTGAGERGLRKRGLRKRGLAKRG